MAQAFYLRQIGQKAFDILKASENHILEPIKVIGTTSKGIFVKISLKNNLYNNLGYVLFLTLNNFWGPLTLNLNCNLKSKHPNTDNLQNLNISGLTEVGEEVLQNKGRLIFKNFTVYLDTEVAIKTNNNVLPKYKNLVPNINLNAFVNNAYLRSGSLYAKVRTTEPSFLDYLLDDTLPNPGDIIGLGPGLTPSGDDLIAGIILMTSLTEGLFSKEHVKSLASLPLNKYLNKDEMLECAYKSTTLISANLIEMAFDLEGDVRILEMLCHVAFDLPLNDSFLSWGAHSGIDTLLGVTLACKNLMPAL